MVERSGLLNRRSANKRYRGFESLSLRHNIFNNFAKTAQSCAMKVSNGNAVDDVGKKGWMRCKRIIL